MSVQMEEWPEQQVRGHKLPGSRYTSREFFEQEWEGMWTKVWLLLGREAEIPNFGDWQMEEVGREEILMTRQTVWARIGHKAAGRDCLSRFSPLAKTLSASPFFALRRKRVGSYGWT